MWYSSLVVWRPSQSACKPTGKQHTGPNTQHTSPGTQAYKPIMHRGARQGLACDDLRDQLHSVVGALDEGPAHFAEAAGDNSGDGDEADGDCQTGQGWQHMDDAHQQAHHYQNLHTPLLFVCNPKTKICHWLICLCNLVAVVIQS